MAESPVIQIIIGRTDADCATVALAMYLGLSYEDVLVAASRVAKKAHRQGMWIPQIERTAKALGVTLRRRKKWDLETSAGILSLEGAEGHVVVLKAGLIFDTCGMVWEPESYLLNEGYTATLLLERRD